MTNVNNQVTVAELPNYLTLVTDSQEIEEILRSTGDETLIGQAGCLFVEAIHGYYREIWHCESTVPYKSGLVWRVL